MLLKARYKNVLCKSTITSINLNGNYSFSTMIILRCAWMMQEKVYCRTREKSLSLTFLYAKSIGSVFSSHEKQKNVFDQNSGPRRKQREESKTQNLNESTSIIISQSRTKTSLWKRSWKQKKALQQNFKALIAMLITHTCY